MARTSREIATWLVWTVGVVSSAMVQTPAAAQEAPTLQVWWDPAVVPRPVGMGGLLGMESVQRELEITYAQKEEQASLDAWELEKIRQAFHAAKDPAKFPSTRDAIVEETAAAIRATLKPWQRERLDQIQLQAQGPFAFARPERDSTESVSRAGPPLPDRLKLSDDQVRRIRAIVEEGERKINEAAGFPIPMDPRAKPSTPEAVRGLVESPEYRAAREKALRAGREARAAVIGRIEEVLTGPQRQAYHKMLGRPYDLSRLRPGGPEAQRQFELIEVARAIGLEVRGRRGDPDFNTKVAHPAYAAGPIYPRVLFDEAHHNFHTAGGRYEPFAELITSDGYRVIPNRDKFNRAALQEGDILIIATALGARFTGADEAANPAFTDAECDAVRDWVQGGGALLLIADPAPFGAAAECLAKRFDVSMSNGTVGDPNNSEEGDTCLVFSRRNRLLGDHPITRGRDDSERINKVWTFTGTSLKGPAGSVPILKLADTAVDDAFGIDHREASAAGRAQGLAFRYGKGRVVVMGEAAELSAQLYGLDGKMGMNVPGIDNRQMALNIMHWLSGLLEPREGAIKKAG